MGETISYSSGGRSQPEPEDGLVQRARQWVAIVDAKPTGEWINGYVLDGINYVEDLCDALEGEEKEVERLRSAVREVLAEIDDTPEEFLSVTTIAIRHLREALAAREREEREKPMNERSE